MSIYRINDFLAAGTNAERVALTDQMQTVGGGPDPLRFFWETDTETLWASTNTGATPSWTEVGAGGATTLASLSDVNITSPSNGQLLQYDNATSKWVDGPAPARTLISEQSPSGVGVVTFSSIPATYRDLEIVVRGRGSNASDSVVAQATFNNDTGANYNRSRVGTVTGSTTSAAEVSGEAFAAGLSIPGTTTTANVAGFARMLILDYRGTTFFKSWHAMDDARFGTADWSVNLYGGYWANTAAITEIDVTLAAGNYAAGSVVSLYGLM